MEKRSPESVAIILATSHKPTLSMGCRAWDPLSRGSYEVPINAPAIHEFWLVPGQDRGQWVIDALDEALHADD